MKFVPAPLEREKREAPSDGTKDNDASVPEE